MKRVYNKLRIKRLKRHSKLKKTLRRGDDFINYGIPTRKEKRLQARGLWFWQ